VGLSQHPIGWRNRNKLHPNYFRWRGCCQQRRKRYFDMQNVVMSLFAVVWQLQIGQSNSLGIHCSIVIKTFVFVSVGVFPIAVFSGCLLRLFTQACRNKPVFVSKAVSKPTWPYSPAKPLRQKNKRTFQSHNRKPCVTLSCGFASRPRGCMTSREVGLQQDHEIPLQPHDITAMSKCTEAEQNTNIF